MYLQSLDKILVFAASETGMQSRIECQISFGRLLSLSSSSSPAANLLLVGGIVTPELADSGWANIAI